MEQVELHEALNEWFEYTQSIAEDHPLRDKKTAERLARYIGTLEGLIVAVTADNPEAIRYVIDRLRHGLKVFK